MRKRSEVVGGSTPPAAATPHPVHVEQYGAEQAQAVVRAMADDAAAALAAARPAPPPAAPEAPRGVGFVHTDRGDEGDRVSITSGEWLVQPVQYNSFRVGAVTVETTVRPGEKRYDALRRAYVEARKFHRGMAEVELKEYLDFLARVGNEVASRR